MTHVLLTYATEREDSGGSIMSGCHGADALGGIDILTVLEYDGAAPDVRVEKSLA